MHQKHREKLIDIGSTTALSALVEIVTGKADGILARQARAMLDRLPRPEDQETALEGFHDEIQGLFESCPGIPTSRKLNATRRAA